METLDAELQTWPPAYKIRISHKAKRLYLKILPNIGLEIIIPVRQQRGFLAETILLEHKAWIEKHLSKLKITPDLAITSLDLKAIDQQWDIKYIPTTSSQVRHAIVDNTLTLYGSVQEIPRNKLWLQAWLKKLAREHLDPWIRQLSLTHQLPFAQLGIRGQNTLWGSCTARKNISLNYKLLFMPPKLAEHIMLHELCHTRHLNHSARFWNLLNSLDPATAEHDRAIRSGEKFVPSWIT